MKIFLTGHIGVGKTTVCKKLLSKLKKNKFNCAGIVTPKTPDGNIKAYDIKSNTSTMLAFLKGNIGDKKINVSGDKLDGPIIGKYFFTHQGIEFGNNAICSGIDSDVLFIDELGQLELNNKGFTKAVKVINFKKAGNIIVVVRKSLLSLYIKKLSCKLNNYCILEINEENRDKMPAKIYEMIIAKNL